MDEGQDLKYNQGQFVVQSTQKGQDLKYNQDQFEVKSRPRQTPLIDPLVMARIESMVEKHHDGSFSCVKCDFKAKKKNHIKNY